MVMANSDMATGFSVERDDEKLRPQRIQMLVHTLEFARKNGLELADAQELAEALGIDDLLQAMLDRRAATEAS